MAATGMRRWTLLKAVCALAVGSCTVVSGIDDKVFDLPSSTGTAGDGGNGGATGGQGGTAGGGGVLPSCDVETLDVPPRTIHFADAVDGVYGVAAQPSAFAVVGVVPDNNTPIRVFGIFSPDGIAEFEDSYIVHDPIFRPQVAAGHGVFAHPSTYQSGGQLQLRARNLDGTSAGSGTAVTTGDPQQAYAVAVADGFLVVFSNGAENLFHTVFAAPGWDPGPVGTFSPAEVCLFPESFAAASNGSTALIAWDRSCVNTEWDIARYDQNGLTYLGAYAAAIAAPRYAGLLDGNFVFATCMNVLHLDAAGEVIASGDLPNTDCAIGGTGSALRMVDDDGAGTMRWREVTTDGTVTDVLSFSGTPDETPIMAFDGSGFVVLWSESGNIRYAHVCVPD